MTLAMGVVPNASQLCIKTGPIEAHLGAFGSVGARWATTDDSLLSFS